MNRARRWTSPGWQRTLIAFALIALSVATAALPHRHALAHQSVATALTASVDLTTPAHDYPCSACARQNGLGLAPAMHLSVAPRSVATLISSSEPVAEQPGQGPNVWLRGPPSATSVC